MGQRSRLHKAVVVGILNTTPDSFSDGGRFLDLNSSIKQADKLVSEGADIIDVGGESTRPNAQPVPVSLEIDRVIPVISSIRSRYPQLPISIDTTKSLVARAALEAGATIVNDVSGFRLDPDMPSVCASSGCQVILMHSRGTMSEMALYTHASYNKGGVVAEVIKELTDSVAIAEAAGVSSKDIILDPGIGFAKTSEQSITLLKEIDSIVNVGFSVLLGTSRKRFLGEMVGVADPVDRDYATAASNVHAYLKGVNWFRVHNVAATRQSLDVIYAINTSGYSASAMKGSE